MKRTEKRKLRKIKARQNRIEKFGGLKYGYSGYQINCYVLGLLNLLRD